MDTMTAIVSSYRLALSVADDREEAEINTQIRELIMRLNALLPSAAPSEDDKE